MRPRTSCFIKVEGDSGRTYVVAQNVQPAIITRRLLRQRQIRLADFGSPFPWKRTLLGRGLGIHKVVLGDKVRGTWVKRAGEKGRDQ
jgi:hypothetical protein